MFDVGFSELLLVGLIALLVFGPERLPRVAREAALWLKKGRAVVSSVKGEIDRELQLLEMKEMLDKQKQDMERLLLAEKAEEQPEPEPPRAQTEAKPHEGAHE
jgi:sec-independent protein translocase protein TatB